MQSLQQWIDRIRFHHAIEHATIHLLSARYPRRPLAGHSDSKGIRLLGDVPTEAVRAAVQEALHRLPEEPELAIHPLCGTNLVVGGIIASVLSLLVLAGDKRSRKGYGSVDILPRLIVATTSAFLLARYVGPDVQRRFTTLLPQRELRISSIVRHQVGHHVVHRITFTEELVPSTPCD